MMRWTPKKGARMSFDRPGLILYTAVTAFGFTAGLSAARYYGGGLDAYLTMGLIDGVTGLIVTTFLAHDYDEWKDLKSKPDRSPISSTPQQEPIIEEVKPRIFLDGKLVHAFTTPQLKINVEMLFARALIAQSRGLLDVKLTEAYWVKSKRWENLGGVGALDFRDLIDRWERAGAIKRKNPNAENSTYIIDDGLKIGRAAAGERL